MKVLVAIDGSDNSMRAANYALRMAQQCRDIEICLLTVVHHFSSSRAGTDLEEARGLFTAAGVDVETKIITGLPEETIIQYCQDQDIDGIIMGSRGRSAIKGIVLGSVSNQILHNAPVPVTIVK